MLQAFIDDSHSERSPRTFALGGYLATAEVWKRFSKEWQRALEMRPRIRYFKLREALRGEGEFNGASERLRTERIGIMRSIVEQFDLKEFGIGFRLDDYHAGFARFGKSHDNPYYYATGELITNLGRNVEKFGLPRARLDIVFDDQVMEKARVAEGWEWAAKHSNPDPPDLISEVLQKCPVWRDDLEVLPLQAADMHATWIRMAFEAARAGVSAPQMPGFKRVLRGFLTTFTRQEMMEAADEMERRILDSWPRTLP